MAAELSLRHRFAPEQMLLPANARRKPRLVFAVCGSIIALAVALLAAKILLWDLRNPSAIATPSVVIDIEHAGLAGVAFLFYWFMASNTVRLSTSGFYKDVALGAPWAALTVGHAAFAAFGPGEAGYLQWVSVNAVYFAFGYLGVSLLSLAASAVLARASFRLFWGLFVTGLVARLFVGVSLTLAALAFSGVQIYDSARTDAIIDDLGFGDSLAGFLTVMAGVFAAAVVGLLMAGTLLMASWAADFWANTIAPRMPSGFPLAVGGMAAVVASLVATPPGDDTGYVAGNAVLALGLAGLVAGLILRFRRAVGTSALSALAQSTGAIAVAAFPFIVQYFAPATDDTKVKAFLFSPLALAALAMAAAVAGRGVPTASQRVAPTIAVAAATAGLGYSFLSNAGLDTKLPSELSANTLFNFILVSSTLLTAVLATLRTVLSARAANGLARRRVRGGLAWA